MNAATGAPVYRALVRANGQAMLTDHEGRFQFDQFASTANLTIEVRKPGYYFGNNGGSTRTLRGSEVGSGLVLRLTPEALITGTVTAPDGSPIPRTAVVALRSIYNQSGHRMISMGQGLTNDRGEFRITVPPGDYKVQTMFSGRGTGLFDAVLPVSYPADPGGVIHLTGGTEQRLELHPVVSRTYPVRLKIETSPERGLPSLLARAGDGSTFPIRVLRGEGSGDGDVQVALPRGTFTLVAYENRGDRMEYGEADVTVGENEDTGVTLQLGPVPPIPVQLIVDPESKSDNTPPTMQQLGVFLDDIRGLQAGLSPFSVAVQQNREMALRVAPGTYRLRSRSYGPWFVKAASYGTTDLLRDSMTVNWGAVSAPVVLTISNLTGTLQGSSEITTAAEATWIYAIPSGPASVPFYEVRSDADGNFRFPNLPPGSYQVIAFEDRCDLNLADGKELSPFSSYVRAVNVRSGEMVAVRLETVHAMEIRR